MLVFEVNASVAEDPKLRLWSDEMAKMLKLDKTDGSVLEEAE